MKLKIEYVFVIVVLLCLTLPSIFINTKKDVVSDIDNRKLVELPDFDEENYFEKFETALSDRIGFRSSFIKLYTRANDFFLKTMVHPTYTYGKDGYVFFHVHKNVEYSEFHHNFALMVSKLQKYCEERGIKFYFLFDPEKLSVYREFLPKGVYYNDEWVTQFTSELDSVGVNYIDNTQLLREKSKNEQVYNKKYDAGHWNDLGMFYGMNNLFSKMHNDFPNIRELTFEDFIVSTKVEKNLPVSYFPINEEVPSFKAKSKISNLTNQYSKDMDLNNQFRHFHYYKNSEKAAENLPKILVFQGSYLNRNGNFIINNASEEIGIHNYQNVLDAPKYINLYKPDCVVFEVAEYTFSDTYFNLERMENLEFPEIFNTENVSVSTNEQKNAFVIFGNSIDKIVISNSIQNLKSAWLKVDNEIYDLNNDSGCLFTLIKKDSYKVNSNFELLYKTSDEKYYKAYLKLDIPHSVENPEYVTENCSLFSNRYGNILKNPSWISENSKITNNYVYEYKTFVEENEFNSFIIQLYNPSYDSYYALDVGTGGRRCKIYTHNLPTGEYTINLRANSNKSDELVSYKVKLVNSEKYYIDLFIDELSSKYIKVHGVKIFKYIDTQKFKFETKIIDNNFNSIYVQLYNPRTNNYSSVCSTSKDNIKNFIYTHLDDTGEYVLNLKANSNKKDEMVSYKVYLENGRSYLINLGLEHFDYKNVVVNKFTFEK